MERMFVDDELVAIFAQHVVFTLSTLVVSFLLLEGFAAVIAEEPIMFKIFILLIHSFIIFAFHFLFLLLKFGQNVAFELLFFLFSLLPELFFFLFLSFFNSLSFFFSGFRNNSHWLFDFSWILDNFISVWFFVSEVILGFVLVHFHTSLFVLFVDILELCACLWAVDMLTEPFFVHNVVSQEDVCLVHLLRVVPYALD